MEIITSGLEKESIVDGNGIRYVVFVQGCPHNCVGCHNQSALPFEGGEKINVEKIFEDFMRNPLLKGITFSGGEPFTQPKPLLELARLVQGAGKDVTCFTGWTYEQLLDKNDEAINALLNEIDMLIDGPFIEAQKNLELRFRGSENQRLIDMKKTRACENLVLLEE